MPETALAPRQPRPASSGADKAAILLLTLGADAAAAVFKQLNEHEIRQLSAAIARLRSIPKDQAAAVHEEAWRRLTDREGFLVDGEQFARKVIASALGTGSRDAQSQAMREIERATQAGRDVLAASLEAVAPAVLAQMLAEEHPQVIAFILANLNPKQAAEVLARLPEALGGDIVLRIAELKKGPSTDVLAEVGTLLQGQARGLGAGDAGPGLGGAKLAAEIMNQLDKTVEGRVFTELDERAPEVAGRIRDLMLTFDDLVQLENRDMQTLLKEVPREELMLALRTASPAMREKIFKNISARAAEILQDDIGQMGPVKLKDVEKAQASIVTIARRLAEEQKITMGGSGGDALV
jgi:flagellar motor switch protein FliG